MSLPYVGINLEHWLCWVHVRLWVIYEYPGLPPPPFQMPRDIMWVVGAFQKVTWKSDLARDVANDTTLYVRWQKTKSTDTTVYEPMRMSKVRWGEVSGDIYCLAHLIRKLLFSLEEGARWTKLKPSYEFHFEGLSNFSSLVEGLVQIQDVNSRI